MQLIGEKISGLRGCWWIDETFNFKIKKPFCGKFYFEIIEKNETTFPR
jgi:hypothetical protein